MNFDKIVTESINNYSLNTYKDIIITNEEASILEKYDFNYKQYNSLSELSFDIEEYLNDNYNEDLEYALINITDRSYYKNTNK